MEAPTRVDLFLPSVLKGIAAIWMILKSELCLEASFQASHHTEYKKENCSKLTHLKLSPNSKRVFSSQILIRVVAGSRFETKNGAVTYIQTMAADEVRRTPMGYKEVLAPRA
jgi:hypothetical protein